MQSASGSKWVCAMQVLERVIITPQNRQDTWTGQLACQNQRVSHQLDQFISWLHCVLGSTWFSMDAQPYFNLIGSQPVAHRSASLRGSRI